MNHEAIITRTDDVDIIIIKRNFRMSDAEAIEQTIKRLETY